MNDSWTGGEKILVQGIIDAYFEEDGELVLVDYKTDRILPGEEKILEERYRTQLDDYAQALERLFEEKSKRKDYLLLYPSKRNSGKRSAVHFLTGE